MELKKKTNFDKFDHHLTKSYSTQSYKTQWNLNNNINYNINTNNNSIITNELTKINIIGNINTSGTQPIIIYKKEQPKNHSYTIKDIKITNDTNLYVSDGGLKKKLKKFHKGHSYSIPNNNSRILKKSHKYEKQKPSKILKNSMTQEKIFSQTMADSFKRQEKPKQKINKSTTVNENKVKNKSPGLERYKAQKGQTKFHLHHKNLSENLILMDDNMDENTKKEKMDKLVANAIAYELRKIKTDNKKPSLQEKISVRKKDFLQENGIGNMSNIDDIKEIDDENDEETNKKNNNNNENNVNKDNNKLKNSIKQKKNSDVINNLSSINIKNHYHNHTNLNIYNSVNLNNNFVNPNTNNDYNQLTLDFSNFQNQKKKKLKPKVNQFEFIEKIQEEQKKLPSHIETYNKNKSMDNNKIISNSSKINDSFRHKSSSYKEMTNEKNHKKNENKEDNKENTGDDFLYATRKNHRTLEELIEFEKKKKEKAKKEEEFKEFEKKKKLFIIFKNLYNLGINNSYDNANNNSFRNKYKKINLNKKNRKKNVIRNIEPNEYYVGTDSSRNCSTVLDINEYYLNILESQQLLVNNGLNKITDFTELAEENPSLNNLIINNNNYNNFNYLNENNLYNTSNNSHNDDKLNEKVNETIKRANDLFSKENFENIRNSLDNKKQIENNKPLKKSITDNSNSKSEILNSSNQKNNTNNINNNKTQLKETKINNLNINSNNNNISFNDNNNINVNNSNSVTNTKEKNLPSLTHTYTNNSNNPSHKIEVKIQPCSIINFIETLRLIIQRKVFFNLYQIYVKNSLSQRYIIAFSYFVAICKQYPFKTIENYCNYKTYYYAFRQLFRPFTRKNFRIFISNCYTLAKIEYFVELLSRIFKFISMERIYIYSQLKKENEQLKMMNSLIIKILNILIKPHLKETFEKLIQNLQKNKKVSIDIKPLDLDNLQLNCSFKSNNTDESLESRSSVSVHPNSVDNDTLRHYQNYVKENKNKDDGEYVSFTTYMQKEGNRNKRNKNKRINYMLNNDKIENKNLKSNENKEEEKKENIKENIKEEKIEEKKEEIREEVKEEKKVKVGKIKIIRGIADLDIADQIRNKKKTEPLEKKVNTENTNNDISASNDKSNISWEYNLSNGNKSSEIIDNTKNQEENQEKPPQKNTKKKKKKFSENALFSFSNALFFQNNNNENENSDKIEENSLSEHINEEIIEPSKTLSVPFKDIPLTPKFSDKLTEEVIKNIIFTEIKSNDLNLIPKKKLKFEVPNILQVNTILNTSSSYVKDYISSPNSLFSSSPKNSPTVGNLSLISLRDNGLENFNDSVMSSYTANSVLNKTIKDKKKEKSINLYTEKIAPILLKFLENEIYEKYILIYDNISKPLQNDIEGVIMALELQNGNMLKEYYKHDKNTKSIKDIMNKPKILEKFSKINKIIRKKDNVIDDDYYDHMLNECVIDSAIEIIEKERIYGNNGEPLPWSNRTRELNYKYDKNNPKKFVEIVIGKLKEILQYKIGLIPSNCENLTQEQINLYKDKKITNVLKNELEENEENWNNLEMEETQLKIEITEIINEQLYNEVMEILEHIVLSRKKPELYENMSIFACEEIPKLSFQKTSMNNKDILNDDDIINIE